MIFLRRECKCAGTCLRYEASDCLNTPPKDTNKFPRCYVPLPEAQETKQGQPEEKQGLLVQIFGLD